MGGLGLSSLEIYSLIGVFAAVMLLSVLTRFKAEVTSEGFLVADRSVSTWRGALSIAVSWVWAPAIFICSLQAYTKGLAGVFWFTLPNVLCFFLFAVVAVKLRGLMPKGYSFPDFIHQKYKGAKYTHWLFLIIAFGYQLGAIIINALAGGTLLSLASGIAVKEAIFYMVAIALAYSLMRGLKASVFTDIIQFLMIIVFGFVLVPWAVFVAGGTHSITGGLAGVSGEFGNMFDRSVAYAMGIPITISLLAGPLADQMFYQRAMAVQKDKIRAVFIRGGLLFGIVPILLSLLGFVGVTLSQTQGLIVGDPQMVAPLVIDMLLPKIGLYMFILMAFAGLCSTMDSAFCAVSSLGAVDVYKRYLNKRASHKKMLKIARDFMVVAAVIGGGIAMLEPKLLWVFFIYGALAGAGFVATIMAVFFKWVGARSLDIAIVLSLVTSLPLSIYANIQENTDLIVLSALSSIIVSFIVFAISGLCHKKL